MLGTFCTMPAIKNSWRNFLDEVIATCLLVFAILAMGRDAGFGALSPFPVTCVIMSIGMSLGATTGYALNPARDLSPRCRRIIPSGLLTDFQLFTQIPCCISTAGYLCNKLSISYLMNS